MAAGCNSSPSSPLQNDIIALVLNLQQAIRNGNEEEAKNLACCLAQKKAFVNVDVCVEEPTVSISNKEIRIKVYVEDKDSSGVCVVLKLKPSMTIRQLKSKMLIEYGFPPEVQKWIVGKRAASDEDILIRCGIKTDGMSMFLYLISPKSIGLSKAKILQKYRHLLPNGMLSNADTNSNTDNSSAVNSPNTDETDVATISRPNTNSSNATPANSEVRSHIRHHTENSKNGTTTTSAVNNLQTASPKKKADSKGKEGWACDMCTYINLPTRPGCEICGSPRPQSYKIPENYEITQEEKDRILAEREAERLAREVEEEETQRQLAQSVANYEHMLSVDNQDRIPNMEEFDCPVCFDTVESGEGVILRDCLHKFCRECLSGQIEHADTAEVKCPYQDDDYACPSVLPDREIKAIVSKEIFQKYLQRSLTRAESVASNSYHCKTADCQGWCLYEDDANFFRCPICSANNCLTCKAIHNGMNCREYQDDLKARSINDHAARKTQQTLNSMLHKGEAMECPTCKIIVQKKDGCDWIQCTMCQTEICWVTKGPRWGPLGEGDTSGGCRCREDNGRPCHDLCVNCH